MLMIAFSKSFRLKLPALFIHMGAHPRRKEIAFMFPAVSLQCHAIILVKHYFVFKPLNKNASKISKTSALVILNSQKLNMYIHTVKRYSVDRAISSNVSIL